MKWNLKLSRSIVPDLRDAHIYGGLALTGWGLWHSPLPWLAGVLVGAALWYMGTFRFGKTSNGGQP